MSDFSLINITNIRLLALSLSTAIGLFQSGSTPVYILSVTVWYYRGYDINLATAFCLWYVATTIYCPNASSGGTDTLDEEKNPFLSGS